MSCWTCFWLFPQKEHLSRSALSPMRAIENPPCRRVCSEPSPRSGRWSVAGRIRHALRFARGEPWPSVEEMAEISPWIVEVGAPVRDELEVLPRRLADAP